MNTFSAVMTCNNCCINGFGGNVIVKAAFLAQFCEAIHFLSIYISILDDNSICDSIQ